MTVKLIGIDIDSTWPRLVVPQDSALLLYGQRLLIHTTRNINFADPRKLNFVKKLWKKVLIQPAAQHTAMEAKAS